MDQVMKILAISGSLRRGSSNTTLLEAFKLLAPADVDIILFEGLASLPHFNPDDDGENAPTTVMEFRNQLQQCDGVLISSPEYAHGVPGSLKNALDWIVSSGDLYKKPVALINASSRATHAQASLIEIVNTMGSMLTFETIALEGKRMEAVEIASDPVIARQIESSISEFVEAIKNRRG